MRKYVPEQKAGTDMLKQNINHFSGWIHNSFEYFQAQWRQAVIAQLIIISSEVNTKEWIALLAQQVTLPIQRLDMKNQLSFRREMTIDQQAYYAPAIGCALKDLIDLNIVSQLTERKDKDKEEAKEAEESES